ncbi:PDZ domain-containing protein [Sphingomonas sp. RIT328]|uniref:PDZ domain-containing protein n=1 Tax=Sphingomonas sp. RIT328 TaxID=1470591 RepID=UPI00044F95AE|nr:PDZ domain-containing protein [Sphingomonas sp. RIT328]EZP49987.1 peptidase Do [Sphingomonas sp. RIT328]
MPLSLAAAAIPATAGHPASTKVGATSSRSATLTVASAVELAAALVRAQAGTVRTIRLASGRYELAAPITIDARLSGTADAPFTIEAAPGAKVELSGARALSPLVWQAQRNGVWRAKVTGAAFQRLWLRNEAQVRARYPNYDPAKLPYGGIAADATSPARVARWSNPAGGILQALHASRWGDVHVPILGKNSDGTLRFGPETGNNRAGPPSEKERFVENVREELDAPHEWFHDAAHGYLYYKPHGAAAPPARGFSVGAAEELIRIVGTRTMPVHDVRIAGLAFRATEPTFMKTTEPLLRSDWTFHRGGAVLIADAERVAIEDGDFQDLGGNAIVISGHARGIAVRRNLIAHVGASAIAFVGRAEAVRSPLFEYHQSQPTSRIDRTPGPKSEDYPADSVAEDNLIHDIGLFEKQSAGVQIAMSARITIDHNSIYRVPRAGINIGDGTWGGHRITHNDVFDTVRESGDHGAYNSWGRDRFWDPDRDEMDRRTTRERSLARLDAVETIVLSNNRFKCDHGWDVDLDDGSSNYLIENNLLLSGGLKLREGFDRVVRNNILLNNTFFPHVWFDNGMDVFERNIVMAEFQPIRIRRWGRRVDRNLFSSPDDLAQARSDGTDARSSAGDPRFVAPRLGDYTAGPASPAQQVGFRNFAMNDFGVRPMRLRTLAERPSFPLPFEPRQPGQREAARSFAGMTIKSVTTPGEQSAAGLPDISGVLVLSVETAGAAASAGLRPGDVILAIDPVADARRQQVPDAATFLAAAQARRWQGTIPLRVFRDQKAATIALDVR